MATKTSLKKSAGKAKRVQRNHGRQRIRSLDGVVSKLTDVVSGELRLMGARVENSEAEQAQRVRELGIEVSNLDQNYRLLSSAVQSCGERIAESTAVAAKLTDSGQKQLHRRVQVSVYDAAGVRIANEEHDLAKIDTLTVTVNAGMVRTELVQTEGER